MRGMKVLLVCGPFGSGATAVAGLLARLGTVALGPYHRTRDPRTTNSYELVAFRDMVLSLVAEDTMSLKPGVSIDARLAEFKSAVGALLPEGESRPLFLKHPAAALLIPQLCKTFDTRLVYVLRPLKDIEATRQRRNWAVGTAEQARLVYARMFDHLVNGSTPTLIVRYAEFVQSPLQHARMLARFAGLRCDEPTLEKASSFIVARDGVAAGG
jgi:hypothetical protein